MLPNQARVVFFLPPPLNWHAFIIGADCHRFRLANATKLELGTGRRRARTTRNGVIPTRPGKRRDGPEPHVTVVAPALHRHPTWRADGGERRVPRAVLAVAGGESPSAMAHPDRRGHWPAISFEFRLSSSRRRRDGHPPDGLPGYDICESWAGLVNNFVFFLVKMVK